MSSRLILVIVFGGGSWAACAVLGSTQEQAGAGRKQWKEKYSVSHTDIVSALAVSPNEEIFATATYGKKGTFLRFWNVQNGQRVSEIESVGIGELRFTPDGKLLAIGTKDKVILWDLQEKKEKRSLDGLSNVVVSLDISRDGRKLAACDGKYAIVWNLETGDQMFKHSEADKSFHSLALSPDGSLLALGSGDPVTVTKAGEISVWNVAEKKIRARHSPTRCGEIQTVAFSPDGFMVGAAGISNQTDGPPKGGTFLWKHATAKSVALVPELESGEIFALAFSPKEKMLASGNNRLLYFWDWTNGDFLGAATVKIDWIGSITFSPSGTLLLVRGRTSGTVQVLTRQ